MYQIDQSLLPALAGGACGLRLRGGGTDYEVLSAQLTSACCAGGLTIGSVNAAQLTARLWGACPPAGTEVTLEARLEQTYLPLGTFQVSEGRMSDDVGELTAYDAAAYAMQTEYVPGDTPPATALALLADVAEQCGLTLADTAGLADPDVTGPLTGYTCKALAGYLAALVGCNAVVDRAGRLALRWFQDFGGQADPSSYYAGALKLDREQTLTGLRMVKKAVLTQTDEDGIATQQEQRETFSAGTGTGLVLEVENPFATQAICDSVWERLSTLGTFRTGDCSFFAGLATEPGDILTVTDRENHTCRLPVAQVRLSLDGGCKTEVSSSAASETEAPAGAVGRMLSRLEADLGAFRELTSQNFTAEQARINSLYADEGWVNSLFSQHITANRMDITGASRFTGVIDAVCAHIGGVTMAGEDNIYTREERYTMVDDDDLEIWQTWSMPGPPVDPGELRELIKIGVWVTSPKPEGVPVFNIWLTQNNPRRMVEFEMSGLTYNGEETIFPVESGALEAGQTIEWGGRKESGMAAATVHLRLYFGDRSALTCEGLISADTQFIENGVPLEEKYAAIGHDHDGTYADINHDHDGTYADINHDHDGDYLSLAGGSVDGNLTVDGDQSVSGDLTVTGDISAANLPIIQTGNTGNIPNVTTTSQTLSVIFPKAFDGTPAVFLTPVQSGGYFAHVKVYSASRWGFSYNIITLGGTSSSISVNWLAVYQP